MAGFIAASSTGLALMAPLRSPTTAARPALAQYGNGSSAKDRQIFVQSMLQAALRSGELKFEKTVL
jgi:hypothetical protein